MFQEIVPFYVTHFRVRGGSKAEGQVQFSQGGWIVHRVTDNYAMSSIFIRAMFIRAMLARRDNMMVHDGRSK
jgi:hypothetical protein